MRGATRAGIIVVLWAMPCLSHAQDWYSNGWLYSSRIAVTVRNTTLQERAHESVVLSVADLERHATDFNVRCFVLVDPAAEPDHEKEIGGNDIPSQADDMDGDGQPDEIAFQVDLGPRRSKRVLLYYQPGEAARPMDYVPQTHAHLSQRYEGPGWESNIIAYRLYLDARNATDVFAKTEPTLSLDTFATPGHDYHEPSEAGVDVLHVGDALGVGGFALLRDGRVMRPEVCVRAARVVARGPVRAVVEVTYGRWPAGHAGREADVTSRFTIWANHRWTEHRLVVEGLKDFRPTTGIVKIDGTGQPVRAVRGKGYLGTWGPQSDHGDDLGLGIVYRTSDLAMSAEDESNHLLVFKGIGTRPVVWWFLAAWEKEPDAVTTLPAFASMLQRLEARLTAPAQTTIGPREQPRAT
ncbi:MAG: DUF4861 family protein [Armatimonadota bacterium]|jgi:hypothetical protein